MKYKELTYQKNFHSSLEDRYLMETVSVVVDIEDGDSLFEVSKIAHSALEKIHRENNPQLYGVQNPNSVTTKPITQFVKDSSPNEVNFKEGRMMTPKEKKEAQIKCTIKQIQEITDPKVLESFKLIAKNNPELQEAYNNKEKELS